MLDETQVIEGLEFIFQRTPTEAEIATFTDTAAFSTTREALSAAAESDGAAGARLTVAFFDVFLGGRVPDEGGFEFWTPRNNGSIAAGLEGRDVAERFANSAEFAATFAGLANETIIETFYNEFLDRPSDPDGFAFWLAVLNAATTFDEDGNIVPSIERNNAIAELGFSFATSAEYEALSADNVTAFLVNGAEGTQDFEGDLDDEELNPEGEGNVLSFTDGLDDLSGTSLDDTFSGPIVQSSAGFGNVTNTFESGDVFDGGAGTDQAIVDITATVTGLQPTGPSISTTSTSVENFFFRNQFANLDIPGNTVLGAVITTIATTPGAIANVNNPLLTLLGTAFSNIDAQNNSGVEQLWSEDSRGDLVIEDVRERSDSVFIGFRDSDPFVSYAVFFDPGALDADLTDSALTLTLLDELDPTDLSDLPIDSVTFTLDGEEFTLTVPRSDDMGNPLNDSYVDFTASLNDAIDATPGLETVTAVLNPDNTITLTDSAGGIFETGTYGFVDDIVPGTGDLLFTQVVGAPIEGPITANLVADGVGRGGEGGVFLVGSMGQRDGVEVFNLFVGDDSDIAILTSTNNILQEVIVTDFDSQEGDLIIGPNTGSSDFVGIEAIFPLVGTVDDRVSTVGLTDVRVFDSTAFEDDVTIGAQITPQSQEKYLAGDALDEFLDPDTNEVLFSYTFGNGENNLSLNFTPTAVPIVATGLPNPVNTSPLFALDILGGSSDDRFNLTSTGTNFRKDSITIDGDQTDTENPDEVNTVELNQSTGVGFVANGIAFTAEQNAFESFTDIDRLVVGSAAGVGGSFDTVFDITTGNLLGLSEIVIATDGFNDTNLVNVEVGTDITISGKNQTLGLANSDNFQDFDEITLTDSQESTQLITLENTGAAQAILDVDDFDIEEVVESLVSELIFASQGINATRNIVRDIDAEEVNRVFAVGTQGLSLEFESLGTDPGIAPLLVDGSALGLIDGMGEGATFNVAFNEDTVNALNDGASDTIIGSTATDNTLALGDDLGGDFGTLFDIPVDTTIDTMDAINPTVSGFANFIFGSNFGLYEDIFGESGNAIAGIFSFANVVATDPTILVGDVSGDFALVDLNPGAVVMVGDVLDEEFFDFNIGFVGTGSGDFSLMLTNGIIDTSDILDTTDTIAISHFDNVTIDIGDDLGSVELALILDDAAELGVTPIAAGDPANDFVIGDTPLIVENILDTLTFTGGDGTGDTLTVEDLNGDAGILASINTVDLSGLGMDFEASVRNTVTPVGGGDVGSANDGIDFILGGDFDVDITLTELTADGPTGDALSVDFNSLFQFTDLPVGGVLETTFTIDNFVGENFANASPDNFSILDFSLIGDIENLTDLDFVDDGTDLTITQTGNAAFEIVLLDVIETDLDVNNLIF